MGSYLDEVFHGDVAKRKEIENLFEDTRYGEKAQTMITAYEKWLGEGMELSILRLLGFFDRPADPNSIAALTTSPAIPELTEALQHYKAREWNQAVAKLRRIKLLAGEFSGELGTLDAHPLLREHFKQQLKHDRPVAWREGHRRIFEHLTTTTKQFPEKVEEMSPLYAAVFHGCEAYKYKEALHGVYWLRTQRKERFFNWSSLGAFSAGLATLTNFFEEPWKVPRQELSDDERIFVVAEASSGLRGLGRLDEAAQAMNTGLEAYFAAENWAAAANAASNLSQLHMVMGELAQALTLAQRSVEYARRTTGFWRLGSEGTLAIVLYQRGAFETAAEKFQQVEAVQDRRGDRFQLTSVPGFYHSEILLSRNQFHEVRVRHSLQISEQYNYPLDVALDNLSISRAYLLEAKSKHSTDMSQTWNFLQRAMDNFRRAGLIEFLPLGLLTRAELDQYKKDYESAERQLEEVRRIAIRCRMGLYLADYHLGFSRLSLAQGDKEKAREHWTTVKKMIDDMGYHRRDKEVEDIEKQLAN